jgi:hypothetical protein
MRLSGEPCTSQIPIATPTWQVTVGLIPADRLRRDQEVAMSDHISPRRQTGVHPTVVKIAMGATLWFLIVTWFSFAVGGGIDWDLAIATLFIAFFFALFLLTASFAAHDPRWHLRDASFHDFLTSKVGTATGAMRGRDVLLEIALVPVSLALAATVIGLVVLLIR